MVTDEAHIRREVERELSRYQNVRMFSNPVGVGWTGEVTRIKAGVLIQSPRRVEYGLVQGSSDLIGWTSLQVTPEMVGAMVAVFTAIELKSPVGRPTAAQVNFVRRVIDAGGYAGIVRSGGEAVAVIKRGG